MSLRDLPFNDMMAQVSRKLIKTSPFEEEKRINEIRCCNHLFVKLREFDTPVYDNMDLTIVECVHCGVTNKYKDLEHVMSKFRKSFDLYVQQRLHYTDVDYNDVTIETRMIDEIMNTNPNLNMMSDEIIRTIHPGVLYQIAKEINPDADNEELFEIMKDLHRLETNEERNKLNSVSEATDLIKRYKEEKGISKTKV